MPYERSLTVSSFKFGLDTRREELVSQPGTLLKCENAHITNGGEIAKRGSFVKDGAISPVDSLGDTGTFGLEVTDAGPIVFGSAINFGGSVTLGQPTLTAAVASPASYQQLKHPELTLINSAYGITYDRTVHRMTSLVYSENFNGKAIAIAQFADASGAPSRFLYYNGSLVYQSSNGLVLHYPTTIGVQAMAPLRDDLIRQIQAIGWGATTISAPGEGSIWSPANDYFTAVTGRTTSNTGALGFEVTNLDQAATVGTRAKAGFKVVVDGLNSVSFRITAPSNQDGTGTVDLGNGTVDASSGFTATQVAAFIVTAINTYTFVHGYSATSIVDDVFVFAPLNFGAVSFNLTVTATGGGSTSSTTHAATIPMALTIIGNPTATTGLFGLTIITVSKKVPKRTTATATLQASATAHATSQVAIASYTWTVSGNGGSSNGINISNANTATASFDVTLNVNTQAVAQFKCVAVDVVGNTATAYVNVAFFYYTVT